MNDLASKLKNYLSGKPNIKFVEDECVPEMAQIVDEFSDFVYGFAEFLEDGSFSSFTIDLDPNKELEFMRNARKSEVTSNQLIEMAQRFAEDFCYRKSYFNALIEWSSDSYTVIFEERDETLNLSIPHTGCSVSLNQFGDIESATLGQKMYHLSYPDVKINKDQAKQVLKTESLLQLAIDVDKEINLVYHPNHEIMGVSVNGEIETVSEYMGVEDAPHTSIKQVFVTETIEDMLGLTSVHELHEDNGLLKRWIDKQALIGEKNVEEMEATILIEKDGSREFYESNVDWSKGHQPLSQEFLERQALAFLEAVVGDIHEKYWLEEQLIELEEDDLSDDEELEDLFEPSRVFTFIRQHRGMKLEGFKATIDVGIYSGIIRGSEIATLDEQALDALDLSPKVSLEEAEEIYFKQMEMKLKRTVENFEEPSVYGLSYIVDFPGPNGHIKTINAHTGKVEYVDSGIIEEI
ncbi:hypothetical protein JOC86_003690 [Bacillus pakistanensis]|uniref:Uncharacterized protein n=1 Tax=Rossellomorea pakistanensis TaxID=992288 RepID=A0ABS2NGX5_9BACI|nr:hypothetical protein [Bacillus pakistanensis]MBM7587117.1 hypothetical protein [Bacillus pakistanensis]